VNARPAGYVPATGRVGSVAAYDRIIAATTRERRFRGDLAARLLAAAPSGGTVVDVGAGTGTFAIALARMRPDLRVLAVDGDPDALAIARAKSGAAAVDWRPGLAGGLPLEDGVADVVSMSLLLHHLDGPGKHAALAEAGRVLRPGGTLHIADWGRAGDPAMRVAFLVLQLVDGFAGTRDHARGRIPQFVRTAGFTDVVRHERLRTVFGRLELLSARWPAVA
jgi:ubiquinone/menaquinone biosynthesis C-methylase UbiE